ncbi:hypothetical protein ACOSQ3_011950 [Xanthoceras sorbifolium]
MQVYYWSSTFLYDFQQASSSPRPLAAPPGSVKWQPSPAAFVKLINSDAALDASRSMVGVGLVLRDVKGQVL